MKTPSVMYKKLAGYVRTEDELLLCSARASMDGANAARIKALLDEDIDWDYLISSARRHALTPLLCHHLDSVRPEAVPQGVMAGLKSHFLSNARRNLFLTAELRRLLDLFQGAGIRAVPYKGPVLAEAAYTNLALREFSDLDILVRKVDIPKAKELLPSNGYTPLYRLNPRQDSAHLEHHYEYLFFNDDGTVELGLHWDVTPAYFSPHFDTTPLWGRLGKTRLGGGNYYSLSPEDTLLVTCVHNSRHCWERLGWITDISEFIRTRGEMDWGEIFERTQTVETERMLLLGLFLANTLLGAPLPEEVRKRVMAERKVGSLAEFVMGRLFSYSNGQTSGPGYLLFQLRMRDRLRDKLGDCLRTAIYPNVFDFSAIPLPPRLFPLYYALRPLRLAGKYGRAMLKRLAIRF